MKLNHTFFLILISAFSISSCTESATTEEKTEIKDTVNLEKPNSKSALSNLEKSSFSLNCDSLEYWFGGIQGTNENEAVCCYKMASCNAPVFYDLIWAPENFITFKKGKEKGEISTYFDETPESELITYLFQVKKQENKEPQDEFDLYEYVFPSQVDVKIKHKGNWYNVDSREVHSFKELGKLKLETITSYNKSL